MKNPSVIARDRIQAARHWVFHARHFTDSQMRGVFALLITIGAFAFFGATIRIHVSAPQQWVERKASIIHLADDAEGKIWALRAREGGPFPSRVDLAAWEGTGENPIDATRLSSAPYQPVLRDFPVESEIAPPAIAEKGERVFPKRQVKSEPVPAVTPSRLLPALYPLSGIGLDSLPRELPPFEQPIDAAMTSVDWRFLLRLRPDGGVAECIGFADEPGGIELAKWLRGVNFGPAVAAKSEWISLGVGFTNQPAHGPDTR